jgi:sugar phosphate isomerase/epimerase
LNTTISAFADEISPDLTEQLENLELHGIGGIDLRSVEGKNVLSLTDKEIENILTECANFGINIQCVASPINKVTVADGSAQIEFEKLVRAGEIAKQCGVKRIRIFTPQTAGSTVEDWDVVRAWMEPMVDHATKNDLILIHENDAKYYGAYPENAKRLFAEFSSNHFKAAFDFANTVQIGFRAMDDWFPWLLPHLDTLHIKDAIAGTGKVVPAGEGDGQLPETLTYLKGAGWSGPLAIEPHLEFAGERQGFSGPQKFEVAVNALRGILARL